MPVKRGKDKPLIDANDWVARVLRKAGPRLCESPSRYRLLSETLANKAGAPALQVLEACVRLVSGLTLAFDDILQEIQIGLGLTTSETHEVTFPSSNAASTQQDVTKGVSRYDRLNAIEDVSSVEDFVVKAVEVAKDIVAQYDNEIIAQNRVKLLSAPRERLRFHKKRIPDWKVGGLGFHVMYQGKEGRGFSSLDVARSHTNEAVIGLIDRLPRFLTSIPVKSCQRADLVGDHTAIMPFVPGMAHDTPEGVKDEILNTLVDYDWSNAALFPECSEPVLREVSYASVARYGPHEVVLATIARITKVPLSFVKRACLEAAREICPTRMTKFLCGQNAEDLFCPRCCVFDCKLHGITHPVKRASMATRKIILDGEAYGNSTKQLEAEGRVLFEHEPEKMNIFLKCLRGEDVSKEVAAALADTSLLKQSSTPALNTSVKLMPPAKRVRTWRRPCNHAGSCNDPQNQCSCLSSGRYCEEDCACDESSCAIIFPSCSCMKSSSSSNFGFESHCREKGACLCRKLGRECSPKRCGCSDTCSNMYLTRGAQGSELIVGMSSIHLGGLGTFAAEPIEKDAFIGEYCGELISNAEADARGFMYDLVTRVSFLFQLCRDSVIDSVRKGNKTKWINYAPDEELDERLEDSDDDDEALYDSSDDDSSSDAKAAPGAKAKRAKKGRKTNNGKSHALASKPIGAAMACANGERKSRFANCRSSIVYVAGEPRICLFAKRDIAAGEELTFNYGRFGHRMSSSSTPVLPPVPLQRRSSKT